MGIIGDKLDERMAEAMLRSEQHMAELASGLAEFQNGNRLTAARPLPIAVGKTRLWNAPCRLVGWSVRATGGTATILLRDSRDAEGAVIAVIDLLDTEHETVSLTGAGVSLGEGLYMDMSGAGTVVGSVWIGARD